MHQNRIQKLLFREYSELAEMVLVESPFAEIDKNGFGIRQVYLGVTPTKLVFAVDQLKSATDAAVAFPKNMIPDPDIENFELLSVYAVESVNLSFFRRNKRKVIKAQLCNEQTRYFELGGFENKTILWNLWCERLKFLNSGDLSSCQSSTSSMLVPLVRSITCFSYRLGLNNERNKNRKGTNKNILAITNENSTKEYGKIACNYSFI